MTRSEILAMNFPDTDILVADGFDDAIIGVCSHSFRAVYSVSKCIAILVQEHDMEPGEAREYFDFNVSGAYVGEMTPIFVEDELEWEL